MKLLSCVGRLRRSYAFLLALLLYGIVLRESTPAHAQIAVPSYRYDRANSGVNTQETLLNPASVNSRTFGKLYSRVVDGQIFAQPLYVPNVTIPGKGTFNVVYVCTQHDSIYAFDADSNEGSSASPLWQVNFINAAAGITTVPSADTRSNEIPSEVGITGTPVIDLQTGTLYVVARTKEIINGTATYWQRLHALDITTGAERPNSPVVIAATVPGTGYIYQDGLNQFSDSVNGTISFNPLRSNQRAALILLNGVVYICWASHGDTDPYHGWIMGYDAATLQQTSIFCTTPNGGQGSIWQSGAPPSVDADGNLFFGTGNGTFNSANGSYGDSIMKVGTANGQLSFLDSYTPYNEYILNLQDLDLGSAGVLLLPDQPGPYPHLLLVAGKEGSLHLLNRDALGGYVANGYSNTVQTLPNAIGYHLHHTPIYWESNGRTLIYIWGENRNLKAYQMVNGLLDPTPVAQSSRFYDLTRYMAVLTSNGSSNGIIWGLSMGTSSDTGANPMVLYAYDASDVSIELYNSTLAGVRDDVGKGTRFATPLIVNGRVYAGAQKQLSVYGASPTRLLPIADAYVKSGPSTTTNFGKKTELIAKRAANNSTNTDNRASYLKFDLGALFSAPATAALQFNVNPTSSPVNGTMTLRVYANADTSWSETALTWNNAPDFNRTNFSSTGTLLGEIQVPLQSGGLVSFDVSSYVQAHFGQVISFQVIAPTVGASLLSVPSRESLSNPPRLVLTYPTAPPVILPNGGTFNDQVDVRLLCATSGADIRYTLDGSEPTDTSPLYSASFILTQTAAVKAKAFAPGLAASETTTAQFTIVPTAVTPTITPNGGTFNDSVDVTLASATPSAEVRYTLDGSIPTQTSVLYTAPFTLTQSATVKATAFKTGFNSSAAASADFVVVPTVATPTINPSGGGFTHPIDVTISCSTPGAAIRFTLDGSIPTETSALYSGPITLNATTSVRAKAFKTGFNESQVAAADFTISSMAATPVISPSGGSFSQPVMVSIACATPSASIYYTLDGSTPTESSLLYTAPFTLSASATVKAKAFKIDVLPSQVASANFAITPTVAAPVISPNGGSYNDSVTVSIACATPGASIYYTLDGSIPTQASTLYTGVFTLTQHALVQAKAFETGFNPSQTTSAEFTILYSVPTAAIAPLADAYVKSGPAATTNFGNKTELIVKRAANNSTNTDNRLSYLKFDLNNPLLPQASAMLRLTVNPTSSPANGLINLRVYAGSNTTWTEPGIVWNNAPDLNRTNFSSTGTLLGTQTVPLQGGTQINFDVSDYVRTHAGQLVSFQVITDVVGASFLSMPSREAGTGQPRLVLAYPTATPMILPNGGTFNDAVDVHLLCSTLGAQIRYTTDGSEPTNQSPLYNGVFTLTQSAEVRAKAFGSGLPPSGTAIAFFSIVHTIATPIITPQGGTFNSPVDVSITCDTLDAVLYYTLDGSDPNEASTPYTGTFTVTQSATVKAKAFKTDYTPSDTASADFILEASTQAATPVISPNGGSFTQTVDVTITCPTAGAAIRFTLDGSEPTDQSPPYYGVFTLTQSATVKAKAFKANYTPSDTASANFTIRDSRQVAIPVISPSGGSFSQPVMVSIACATPSASIYYTLDGSTPTESSLLYTAPFTLSASATVKAKAFKIDVLPSQVASANFAITPTVAAPVISPNGGSYNDSVTVSIACATPGASIYYTLDGSTPTESSQLYTAPLVLTTTATVKAIAGETGFNSSAVTSADFVIAATITNYVTEDSYVRPSATYANVNFGSETRLIVKKASNNSTADYNRASYVKFDLTNVTLMPTIARLRFNINQRSNPATGVSNLKIYAVDPTAWQETTITFNNAPNLNRTNFTGTGTLLATLSTTLQAGSRDIDLTPYIAAHIGQQVSFLIIEEGVTNLYMAIDSKEFGGPTIPRLILQPF